MTSIRKPSPPEHIVVCDTNILWHEDKQFVVNSLFNDFWDTYSGNFPMQLIIPDVVRGELLFQQTTSATKLLAKANAHIENITNITEKKYSHQITPDRIKREITDRFDRWLHVKKAEVKSTPVNDVDWVHIIEAAIWRDIPFTADAQNPKNEKGFRDAMILETVCSICKFYSDEVNIAFLCNDYSLRRAAEIRIGSIESVSIYESLEEFESFIQLTKQNLTERFVKSILSRARDKFFKPGDNACLLYKDGFYSRLRSEFRSRIDTPTAPDDFYSSLLKSSTIDWKQVGSERAWLSNPQFVEVADENVYRWKSQVNITRLFERPSPLFAKEPIILDRRLLKLVIDIHWQATVRANGRFFDCKIINYEESHYSFDTPTENELERHGIQKKVEQGAAANP